VNDAGGSTSPKNVPRTTAGVDGGALGERIVAGCMTGTSIDGLDVAVVRVTGAGLSMRCELLALHSRAFGELGAVLRSIASGGRHTAGEMSDAAWTLGELHAEAIAEALGSRQADLVCVHGQTVMHVPPRCAIGHDTSASRARAAPDSGATKTLSRGRTWQMLQPAPIAARLRCPVVFDLRAMDVALGGQGAPITPIADWVLCRSSDRTRAVLNLGGFANATILPAGLGPESVRGFDICACNQLLDAIARDRLNAPFDRDGGAACAGRVNEQLLTNLSRVLESQARAGRSLGSGDELAACVADSSGVPARVVARTACEAIGGVIGRTLASVSEPRRIDEVYLAGGGAYNPALVGAISRSAGVACERLDSLGIGPQAREAMCFAVLGALCQDRVPITLPRVTGVPSPAPVSGAWCLPA
jgi:anhydro-N-acetylmuramic acid kinase